MYNAGVVYDLLVCRGRERDECTHIPTKAKKGDSTAVAGIATLSLCRAPKHSVSVFALLERIEKCLHWANET